MKQLLLLLSSLVYIQTPVYLKKDRVSTNFVPACKLLAPASMQNDPLYLYTISWSHHHCFSITQTENEAAVATIKRLRAEAAAHQASLVEENASLKRMVSQVQVDDS